MARNTPSATLLAQSRQAMSRAQAYLLGRQSQHGGFCFYRTEQVDEPNLHDTYHAVAALALLHAELPRRAELLRFLNEHRLFGAAYLYYYAFTLDLLGMASRIDKPRLTRLQNLALALPHDHGGMAVSGWLESTRRILRLKRRFTGLDRCPEWENVIENLKHQGGYGIKPNLLDTYRGLHILMLLGHDPGSEETRNFVDRLQVPYFGFALTDDSRRAQLDVIYAGVQCCEILKIKIKYPVDILSFVLACQAPHGGFASAPNALPNIVLTRRALQIIGFIDRNPEKSLSPECAS